jgi:hypothetical protein
MALEMPYTQQDDPQWIEQTDIHALEPHVILEETAAIQEQLTRVNKSIAAAQEQERCGSATDAHGHILLSNMVVCLHRTVLLVQRQIMSKASCQLVIDRTAGIASALEK